MNLKAQIVNIPDTAFLAKIIAFGIDTNNDGQIQQSEALAADSLKVISSTPSNIYNTIGLQAFTNLTYLEIGWTNITSLNVSTLTNLQTLNCYSNQLTTFDAAGLNNLQYFNCAFNNINTIDNINNLTSLKSFNCIFNNIANIDLSAATNLEVLNCSYNSTSALTIFNPLTVKVLRYYGCQLPNLNPNAFSNLEVLECSATQITALNVPNLIHLKKLECSYNQIMSLDLSNQDSLVYLDCGVNQLSTLDVTNLGSLKHLDCRVNQISSLNLTNLPLLKSLCFMQNQLTNLDISQQLLLDTLNCARNLLTNLTTFSNLTNLDCSENQLTNVNLAPLSNLTHLTCSLNPLNNLNLINNNNLIDLRCDGNLLTNLNITNLVNLMSLSCANNSLTNLDVSNAVTLSSLFCNNNNINVLDLTNCPLLYMLDCSYNNLVSLDLTFNPALADVKCSYNNLTYLLCKNGTNEMYGVSWTSSSFSNNPNLQYVCVDADLAELQKAQQMATSYGLNPNIVNTFCSFNLGGVFNTISGEAIYDANANGCNSNDSAYSYMNIQLINSQDTSYIFTNSTGNYLIPTDSGNYTLEPIISFSTYFSANPLTTNVYFPNVNNNTSVQDFCVTPNGIFPDVEVVLSPLTPSRSGFQAVYNLWIHNKGTTSATGNLTFDFQANKMTFDSASVVPNAQTSSQLSWNYNLAPSQYKEISIIMNILPPPSNNLGDSLLFHANIALLNDSDSTDNNFILKPILVGSYDPNDKTCLEGAWQPSTKIGEYLHYLVRFQNTGTFYAERVVVADSINANQFEVSSIQLLSTSHPAKVKVENNVLQFHFEQIMLADSFTNEPESHGYVLFKIKTKDNLPSFSTVSNKAEIYFDFNAPIITNTANTTFSSTLPISPNTQTPHFQCYPNPAQNELTLETPKKTDFVIYNALGTPILATSFEGKKTIDIAALPRGLYWVRELSSGACILFVKE